MVECKCQIILSSTRPTKIFIRNMILCHVVWLKRQLLISVQLNTITHSYREHSHWLHSGIQLQLNNKDDFRLWLAPDNDHDEPGHCGEPVSSVVVLAQIGFSHALMITLDKIWLGFDGWNGNCLTTAQHHITSCKIKYLNILPGLLTTLWLRWNQG